MPVLPTRSSTEAMASLSLLAGLVVGCASAAPPRVATTDAARAPTTSGAAPRPAEAAVEAPPTPTLALRTAPEPSEALLMDAPPRCPSDMALIDGDVCIDRFEASLVRRSASGADEPWSPYGSVDRAKAPLRAVSEKGRVPQGYVSGEQAALACEAAGKRLCAADEWDRACRGPRRLAYPYGPSRREGVCNDDGRDRHPVAEATARQGIARERMWYEGMDLPLINQLPDTVDPSGSHPACQSDYGVFDMVGNLHEWIDDPEGTFRGGYFMDTQINGEGCDYTTTAHGRTYHDYSTGFRCCMDADPVE
ncbi:MAG: SUMF1/EgtB/PvdO family nonheme iron enzyme [Myxococcales bacterium]|nr:SUMF1/EgtB/PvdO family nonheme iron enzyme [Myxococcales bacterium]